MFLGAHDAVSYSPGAHSKGQVNYHIPEIHRNLECLINIDYQLSESTAIYHPWMSLTLSIVWPLRTRSSASDPNVILSSSLSRGSKDVELNIRGILQRSSIRVKARLTAVQDCVGLNPELGSSLGIGVGVLYIVS